MQQPTVTHFSVWVNSLLIKTGEGRRRSDAVKTMTVIKDTKFHAIDQSRTAPADLDSYAAGPAHRFGTDLSFAAHRTNQQNQRANSHDDADQL